MNSLQEKEIEQKLRKSVKAMGGICPKFVSPSYDGMPDRLILLSNGKIAFAELKAKGKKPRPIQVRRIEQLRKLGFKVYVIDDVKQIGGVLDEIRAT